MDHFQSLGQALFAAQIVILVRNLPVLFYNHFRND